MKQVSRYLYRMLKHSPGKIVSVWTLDSFSSLIRILMPMLLGKAIDGLIDGDCKYFWFLLAVLIFESVIGFIYRRADTRTYERITADFEQEYLEIAKSKDVLTDRIDANIKLVDDFSEFLRWLIINFFIAVGIIFPLIYLYIESEKIVFLSVLFAMCCLLIIQFRLCVNKQEQVNFIKDQNENRRTAIWERNTSIYRSYRNRIVDIAVNYSDADALSYIISAVIQLALLAFSVVYVVTYGHSTAGVIFATITYIIELNDKSFEVSEVYEKCLDLKDSISRVDI